MKKLLSICFLSILLTLAGFVARAQSPCCVWLENMNPDTLTGIANVPGGQLVLNNAMNPVNSGYYTQTDVYKIHFINSCNIDKLSIDWKVYRDGQLVNGNLSDYADFSIYTFYNRLNQPGPGVQIPWLGGQVLDGHGIPVQGVPCYNAQSQTASCKEGYPGAMSPDTTFSYSNDYQYAGGYTGIYSQHLDYLNAEFFEQTENIIIINWKQVGDYSLVISIRERTGGSDWTNLYWNQNQDKYIGGHMSTPGRIVATDSIAPFNNYGAFDKEICDGGTFEYGKPAMTFDATGDYVVAFIDTLCGGHCSVTAIDTLHLYVRTNPVAAFLDASGNDLDTVENCFGGNLTQADLEGYAHFATPDADGLTYKEIQWATTNHPDSFKAVVPTPVNTVGTYTFFMRQVNLYANFNEDSVWCEGPVDTLTYIVHQIPGKPTIGTPNYYYCVGSTATSVDENVTPAQDCKLHWAMDNTFNPEISGAALIPSTTAAGVQTFYVYQNDTLTGCFSKDSFDIVTVTVYDNPVVTVAANPTAACLGTEFTLTATAGFDSYAWVKKGNTTTLGTANVLKITPTAAGDSIYSVTVGEDHKVNNVVVVTCNTTADVTITIYPIPAQPTLPATTSKSYCLNEDIPATYPLTATAPTGAVCVWFDEAGNPLDTANSYTVDLNSIKPTGNEYKTVKYYVASYNPTTTCISDQKLAFTFDFYKYPVLAVAPKTSTVCPGVSVNLTASLTTESKATYTYTWSGDVNTSVTTNTNTINTSDNDCTGKIYKGMVYVTDGNGCKSNTDTAVVNVKDSVKPVVSTTAKSFNLYGCNTVIVPAAYTTLAALTSGAGITVTDACGKLETSVSHSDVINAGLCTSTLTRTYTVSDHCGNTATYVETYTVTDTTRPTLTVTPSQVDPVPAMNCTYIMPDDTVFVNLVKGNVSDNCTPDTELVASVKFFNGMNTDLASANTDIFADSLTVNIYAQISDRCGNKSNKVHIATLVRPEPMYIKHGSVSIDRNELCLYDTVNLSFSTDSIAGYNHAPYSFLWTGRPNDGTIIHHTWQNALGIPALPDTNFVYTITVTDKYGCVAKDSSDPVHVWNLPTVYIHEDIRNGATFPLCPNYGVLTVEAVAVGRIPGDNSVTYEWSGESVNIYSHNDTTGVYILPDSCNYTYYPHVKVTNIKGCVAEAEFPFNVVDTTAPVVDASAIISDTTLIRQPGCKFFVPDMIPLFNNNNVSDNCYKVGTMTLTQTPVAGTEITENKVVTITLTDHCGNSSTFNITAKLPSDNIAITNIAVVDDTAFCLNGSATLTPSTTNVLGTPRYTWTEGSNTLGTDAVLTVTPTTAGVHTYQLSVVDSLDCEATKSVNITVYPLPAAADVTLASTPNEFCKNAYNVNNEFNGTISVTNITPGYQYKLSTDTTWRDANYVYTGLNNGTYDIDLKSNHDCETMNAATIVVDSVNNMILSTATGTANYRCADPYDGTITVNNPQVNYTYEIINVPNSERVYTSGVLKYEGLRNGDYLIQVVSDKYCPYSIYNTIVADSTKLPELPSYVTTPKTSCVAPNGAITIQNSNPDFEYTLNNVTLTGNGSDLTFGQLNGGDYTLAIVSTVTACSQQFAGINVPTTTQDPARPLVDSVPNTVCDLAITPNGSITVTNPINGYTYQIGDSVYTYDGTNVIKFVNLIDANSHIMTVTSDLGCAKDYTFEVTSNIVNPAKATFVSTNNTVCTATLPTCVSIATPPTVNGTISLTNTDDNHYTYKLLQGNTEILPTSGHSYTGLAAGTYTIRVRDNATGCESDTLWTILDEAAALTIAAGEYTTSPRTSCTTYDGSITINAANGYNYYICNVSNQAITGTQGNLDAGKYNIVKYNIATGCFREDTVTVEDARARYDTIKYDMVGDIVCDNATFTGTGSITVTNLSTSDFTFFINGAINTNTPANVFVNLHDGDYIISVVNNATQCPGQKTISVSDITTKPVIKFNTTANTYCTDTIHDGTVTITPEANCAYTLFAADSVYGTTTTITGLKDGDYKLAAYNTLTGCTDTANVTINHTPIIPTATVAATAANYNCKPEKNGSVTITSSLTDVTYYLVSAMPDTMSSITPTFNSLDSGTYTYYVISSKGCVSAEGTVTVADSAHIYELELSQTPNTMCVPTFEHPGNGTIVVEKPQARHYTYSFYDNAGAQIDVNYFNPDSYTMYHLKDMLYKVVVNDTITKCTASDTISVLLHHDDITVTADSTDNDRCVAPYNGTVTVNMVNPNIDGVYRYKIDGGAYQISNVFDGLKEGDHEVLIWDTTTNCTYPVAGPLKITVNKKDYNVTINPSIKDNDFCVAPFNGAIGLSSDSVTSDVPTPTYLFAMDTNASVDLASLNYTSDTVYEQLGADVYYIWVKETSTECVYGPFTASINTVSANAPIIDTIISSGYNNVSEYNFCPNSDAKLCAEVSAQVASDTLGYGYLWSCNCFPWTVLSDSSCVDVITSAERLHCEYTVEVTSLATGCVTTKTIAVTIDTTPVVHFYFENPARISVPSHGVAYNCENNDYVVGVTNPIADYDSIFWTQPVYVSGTHVDVPANTYTAPTEISYCVNLVDHNGCIAHDYMNVNIKPVANHQITQVVCDSTTYRDQKGLEHKFYFVEGGPNYHTFVDTFANGAANGCDSFLTVNIIVNSSPILTVDSSANYIERHICHGNPLHTDNMLKVKYTSDYGWKFGTAYNSADAAFDPTANLNFADSGRTVYAYAVNNCDTVVYGPYTLNIDSLPIVPNITTNSPYCDSTDFDLTVPVYTCNGVACTGKWQLNAVDTIISKFVYGMNNGVIRYAVTNACGTSYSNELTLTVYNTAKLDLTYTFDSLCVGTTGDITFTVNPGNTDTLVFDSKYFKVAKNGNTYTITPDSANVGVSSVDIYSFQEPTVPAGLQSACQFVKKTVEFYIVDKPVVDVVANPDSICAGDVLKRLVAPSYNAKNGDVLSEGWLIKHGTGNYEDFDPITPLYMINHGDSIKYQVTNRCGTSYSNAVPVVVDTVPSALLSPATITYCVGDSIHITSDLTLSVTTTPTAPLTIAPVLKLDGNDYTAGNALTMADSNKNVWYVVTNKCGSAESNTIKVVVNDTASLVTEKLNLVDTICVGSTMDFKVTVHKSNVMTYQVSSTTDFEVATTENVTADVKETKFDITPKVATDGAVCAIYVKVESAVAACDREKFDTIRFTIADTAHFSTAPKADTVCEGTALTLVKPSFTTPNAPVLVEKWESNVSGSWADFTETTPMTKDYNGKYLRYSVETRCGVNYSDSIQLMVYDTVKLTTVSPNKDTLCSGTAMDDQVYSFEGTYVQIGYTFNPASITGVSRDSVATTTDEIHTAGTYTIKGTDVQASHGIYEATVTATSTVCPATNKSLTFELYIDTLPTITFNNADQLYCIDETPNFKRGEVVTLNAYNTADSAVVGYIKKNVSGIYTDWSKADYEAITKITAELDSAFVTFRAVNHCDTSVIIDSILIVVEGKPTVTAPVVTDTCVGSPLIDFVKTVPVVTLPTRSSRITAQGWLVENASGDYVPVAETTPITQDTNVKYYAATRCGYDTCVAVRLVVTKLPEITDTLYTSEFTICSGDTFASKTMHYVNVAKDTTTLWTITKAGSTTDETLVFGQPYDTSYNNATIRYIVVNECGADTVFAYAHVDTLPVPVILGDTTVCATGSTTLSVTETGYVTYQWFMDGDTIVGATAPTYDYTSAGEGSHTFTVSVKDGNGCYSTYNINGTYDKDSKLYKSDSLTVEATDAPRFIFKDVNGTTTHRLPDATTSTDMANKFNYTWMVSAPCSGGDELVFVTFDFYHDGQLISNDSIGVYFKEEEQGMGVNYQKWMSTDYIEWLTYSPNSHLTNAETRYDFAQASNTNTLQMGNHFPNKNLAGGNFIYDDVYLHFLNNRPVSKTVSPAMKAGEYKIVYRLISTSRVNLNGDLYYNVDSARNLTIGGYNSIASNATLTELVVDTLKFTVTGEDLHYTPSPAVEPEPEPILNVVDEPTVKVYPNPTSGDVNANIEGFEGAAVVRIVTLAGKVVSEETVSTTKGASFIYSRTTADLTPGVYFLTVQSGDAKVSKKLVVTR
jgi:hypothetical protein